MDGAVLRIPFGLRRHEIQIARDEASWDQNGDVDRARFLAEIGDGKQKIVETLPKLKAARG
ncbi:hypothetical protein [Bradyrhizobium sp. 62]|uniref:hypothetical protein n=1 Tax=Bradyrhizobium sp. 62 TaxID=1043588 RepID=UPI001FFA8ED2|nr:hypothetical protein [Bradyrhizobium sp. 62]MCK1369392.1 hypothetical protein [Bradyrhizobium sp. 62]